MGETRNKYEQVYDYIKDGIENGTFRPGDLLSTDVELAKKFGASRPTVAKAMTMLKDAGLIKRRPGYGTCVKSKGGDGAVLTLGLLIPGLGETEIFEPICARIADLAEENNFNLIWGGGGTSADINRRNAEPLARRYLQQEVDGVFFTPVELIEEYEEINSNILSAFNKAGIPTVLLDRDIVSAPLFGDYDLVGLDNIQAGFTIGLHLIEKGCKTLGFVTHSLVARTVEMRMQGVREAMARSGMDPSGLAIYEITEDEEVLTAKLVKSRLPEGLIVYNDAAAARLMQSLENSGVKIPGDYRMTGFDDVKYSKLLSVPLTTYRQPCSDIGTAAVETMISRIRTPELSPRKIQLKGKLIKRRSSE